MNRWIGWIVQAAYFGENSTYFLEEHREEYICKGNSLQREFLSQHQDVFSVFSEAWSVLLSLCKGEISSRELTSVKLRQEVLHTLPFTFIHYHDIHTHTHTYTSSTDHSCMVDMAVISRIGSLRRENTMQIMHDSFSSNFSQTLWSPQRLHLSFRELLNVDVQKHWKG